MALTRLQIAQSVENISLVTNQRALVNQSINIALDRVYQWYDWPYYLNSYDGIITTVANYTTGTITINNGSTLGTINAPGVVSSVWNGVYKIRIGNDKTYYRILTTGVGTITLLNPYTGSSVVASGFSIFKDEYVLNSDVDKYKIIRQMKNGFPLVDLTPTTFDKILPSPQNLADPIYNIMEGTIYVEWSGETVSVTPPNLNTLVGVGTTWLSVEGLGRMSRVRIGNNVYTIASVDSDTQITTYEQMTTIAPLSSYVIMLNNLVLQFYYIPNSTQTLYYRYFRQPMPLCNDYDTPDMPYEFHWLLIYGALSFVYLQKGDINKAQQEAEARFMQGLEMMKIKLGSFAPDRIYRRKSIDGLRRRRFEGVENSNYDWRYSAY